MSRNHHYVSKQVNPNLGTGMYPSSFYSSSNPRDDGHRHYREGTLCQTTALHCRLQHPLGFSSIHIQYELDWNLLQGFTIDVWSVDDNTVR